MLIKARWLTQPQQLDEMTNTIGLDSYQKAITEHHLKAFPELIGDKLLYALLDKLVEEVTELDEACRLHREVYGSKRVYSIANGLHNPVMDEAGDVLVVLLRLFELYGLDTYWMGEALDRSVKKFKEKYPAKEAQDEQHD